ncbi:MAG: TetR/AcrR family transcriptional regulator [Proteobacteria bacterium]|nr:MAG: TetR/AcrR family transcriptional regulator [Pseudomonadota bacterium]
METNHTISSGIETKSNILKASLALFNEQGTEAVTFADIARDSNISVAELQFFFKDKKSIVRAMFYEIEIFSVRELWQISPQNREVRFADFMQFYFTAFAKYRFFFREFSMLIQQDSILANDWRTSYERLVTVMQEALSGWVKQGLVKPFATPKDAEIFIELVWVIAAFTPVHLRARKDPSKFDTIREVNQYVVKYLYPYHTERGQRVLDLYL